jgi:hypothetical protein
MLGVYVHAVCHKLVDRIGVQAFMYGKQKVFEGGHELNSRQKSKDTGRLLTPVNAPTGGDVVYAISTNEKGSRREKDRNSQEIVAIISF